MVSSIVLLLKKRGQEWCMCDGGSFWMSQETEWVSSLYLLLWSHTTFFPMNHIPRFSSLLVKLNIKYSIPTTPNSEILFSATYATWSNSLPSHPLTHPLTHPPIHWTNSLSFSPFLPSCPLFAIPSLSFRKPHPTPLTSVGITLVFWTPSPILVNSSSSRLFTGGCYDTVWVSWSPQKKIINHGSLKSIMITTIGLCYLLAGMFIFPFISLLGYRNNSAWFSFFLF